MWEIVEEWVHKKGEKCDTMVLFFLDNEPLCPFVYNLKN